MYSLDSAQLQAIEREAMQRSQRFRPRAWQQWLAGPGLDALCAVAARTDWPVGDQRAVADALLRLATSAVEEGYLSYSAEHADDWSGWVWRNALPLRFSQGTPRAVLEELAALWNLSERLAHGEPWRQGLFYLFRQRLLEVGTVAAFVAWVETQLLEETGSPLPESPARWCCKWISVGGIERYGVAQDVRLMAPRLAAVRIRETGPSVFVHLSPAPVVLGTGVLRASNTAPSRDPVPAAVLEPFLVKHSIGALRAQAVSSSFWLGVPELSQRLYVAWSKP